MFKKVVLFSGYEIPIDQEEEEYIIGQIARRKICICKQGTFAASAFMAIVEDHDREMGWNRVLDQKSGKIVPTSKRPLTDGFKSARDIVGSLSLPNYKPNALLKNHATRNETSESDREDRLGSEADL